MDKIIRRTTGATTAIVALSGAILSYAGLRDLAVHSGIHHSLALLLPVAVDGLIFAGMLGVIHATLAKSKAGYPWLLVILGLAFSVWGNAAGASSLSAQIVHGAAPIALALSLEALAMSVRRRIISDQEEQEKERKRVLAAERAERKKQQATKPKTRKPAVRRDPGAENTIRELAGRGLSQRAISEQTGISKSTVGRILREEAA